MGRTIYTTRWGVVPPRHVRAAEGVDHYAAMVMERRALEAQVGAAMRRPSIDRARARAVLNAMTDAELDKYLTGEHRG